MPVLAPLVPVTSWVLLIASTGVLLTTPLQYRPYGFPALLILANLSFRTIHYWSDFPGLPGLWGLIILITFIHCSSLLYLKKWTLRIDEDTGKDASTTANGWLDRELWIGMYRVAANPRFVRIPYKHLILGEQGTGAQVKSTAIHRKFSTARVGWLLVNIGVLFLLHGSAAIGLYGVIGIEDFTPAKASLLRHLLPSAIYRPGTAPPTTRDIVLRIWSTITALWTPVVLLDTLHTAIAIFFIYILRIDIAEDWPDLFGSPLEAYTIGRFWMS